MTIKGFCAQTPSMMNALAPDVVRISWGAWLTQGSGAYGNIKWVIDLSEIDPNFSFSAANVAAAMQHSCYCGKFLIGNEPYLNGYTPQGFANMAIPQMDLVQSVDPNALFGIAAGINIPKGSSQYSPIWYEANSWFRNMFPLLPARHRKNAAIALHTYHHADVNLIDFLRESNGFRNETYAAKELWLSEVGRHNSSGAAQYNPTNVHAKCQTHNFAWWAWYAQQPLGVAANYMCLQETNGTLTQYGQDFKGI